MSLGYADRLSYREDLGGRLGAPEVADAPHVALAKAEQLAELVRTVGRAIAYTGAGISTSCGIPDFRGPNGVWTAQRKGLPAPKAKVSFLYAQPSLTHMALLGLMHRGTLAYICSQNVDSLHLRSGVPRSQLAELHGNCFAERCSKCKTEYVRDFEMNTVGFKPTGRVCTKVKCRAPLVDHILDWEDALPPAELKATEQHGSAAGLAMCLGTSLQIIPAANLPLRTVKAGGSLAIINLQATPKDKHAAVVIHAKVDAVMAVVMQRIGAPIPAYVRTDRVLLAHKAAPVQLLGEASAGLQQQQHWSFELSISSVHGEECPLPMVTSARVCCYGRPGSSDPPPAAAAAAAEGLPAAAGEPAAAPAAAVAAAGGAVPPGVLDPAAAAAAPAEPAPASLEGLQQVLPAQECGGALPWGVRGSLPADVGEVVAVVTLQLADAADADKRTRQVHYTIKQPQASAPPAPSSAAAAAAAGGGGAAHAGRVSRSASARAREQQQQPDGSEMFSLVTQVRDYSAEQQQLVAEFEAAAAASRLAAPVVAPGSNGSAGARNGGGAEWTDGSDGDDDGAPDGEGSSGDSDFRPGRATGRGGGRKPKRAKRGA